MGISTAAGQMTSEEIVELSRRHTFFSWSAQGAIDPIAIDRAEGVYLYTPEGKRILDFNSQLMSVNIGHGDRRVIDAITAQATKLQYVQPAFATEPRARLGAKLAEILPGDLDKVFLTLGGAEADRERDQARPRLHRPPQDPRPLPRLPRRDPRGDDADRRPAPLGERARHRRRRPLPGHPSLGREGAAAGRREPPGPRGRHPLRGRPHDRRRLPRDDRRDERHPHPARRLHPGRPRDLHPQRHPDGRRRGDGRLRPDRALVRDRQLGHRPGPDDDGQGPDLVVPAARRGGDEPQDRQAFRHELLLRRPDVHQPRGQLRRRPRQHLGLRGGRAARELAPARRGHAPPPRGALREASLGRRPPQPRVSSGSSTSSGRASRSRR